MLPGLTCFVRAGAASDPPVDVVFIGVFVAATLGHFSVGKNSCLVEVLGLCVDFRQHTWTFVLVSEGTPRLEIQRALRWRLEELSISGVCVAMMLLLAAYHNGASSFATALNCRVCRGFSDFDTVALVDVVGGTSLGFLVASLVFFVALWR